ncbi:Ubiquinone biosynthesis O-methyltransferase [Hibiscus syriacus]|uniref:Ubiquinone biosynthesis O-methyltransferase n=1 Tax=Hibiscus syriacus TaxID=106335 RepID=A0A6A2ZR08_HIBSY|nr:Ubiquinone biosynthesis O-methyltransferase [Hibiscus syriacus]
MHSLDDNYVIEHVADPAEFCKSLSALTAHEGATVVSTINRSMRSYATAIIAAEYLLHLFCSFEVAVYEYVHNMPLDSMQLPKGTHQWSSFLTPEELTMILRRASIDVREMAGFAFNPITGRWSLSDDIRVRLVHGM